MTGQPEALVQIATYEVSILPEGDINRPVFTITVENRGEDRWAVVRHRECMNAKGEWSWESVPSEREDEWLDEHRFNRMTALELAKWAAPRIVVNGHSAVDAYNRTHPVPRSTAREES
jgi:hypothetical protein